MLSIYQNFVLMKRKDTYETPTIEIIAVEAESVLCGSPVFGNEGLPGDDFFDDDDIFDGGPF